MVVVSHQLLETWTPWPRRRDCKTDQTSVKGPRNSLSAFPCAQTTRRRNLIHLLKRHQQLPRRHRLWHAKSGASGFWDLGFLEFVRLSLEIWDFHIWWVWVWRLGFFTLQFLNWFWFIMYGFHWCCWWSRLNLCGWFKLSTFVLAVIFFF